MPPKSRQTKLPRRRTARDGELNLEAAAEERIDAITAEPLQTGHFVEIFSPDRTLRLFYNTSTLVRIANDKGGFMQPPHFREPMHASLVRKIEEMEGKRFRFEKIDTFLSARGDVEEARGGGRPSGGGELDGVLIHHRHVYFDQIIDEFYHLNPAEVYVCPVCYEHYLTTRYVPFMVDSGSRVDRVSEGSEERPVVDPLDVLCYMLGGAVDVDETEGHDDDAWDTPLAHIVFRRAAAWKRHMSVHHDVSNTAAADYRLRDVLCTYHDQYNRLQDARHAEKVKRYGDAQPKPALTQQRYWQLHARYNCLRYNRVVEAAEKAEAHPEAVEESAFPGEIVAQDMNPTAAAEVDSDFIVDDDATDSEEGSGNGDGFFPRFQGGSLASSSDGSASRNGSSTSTDVERERGAGRGKSRRNAKRERSSSGSVSSSASCAADSSEKRSDSVTVSSEDSSTSADDHDDAVVRTTISQQRALFNRGLLKETDCYYQRLSAEDRSFVAHAARQTYTPSRLYDPILHRKRGGDAEDDDARGDDIDWENIGDDLATRAQAAAPTEQMTRVERGTGDGGKGLLLSDDSDDRAGSWQRTTAEHQTTSTTQAGAETPSQARPSQQPRLLLDDEDA